MCVLLHATESHVMGDRVEAALPRRQEHEAAQVTVVLATNILDPVAILISDLLEQPLLHQQRAFGRAQHPDQIMLLHDDVVVLHPVYHV